MTRLVGYTRELTPGTGTAADAADLVAAGAVRVFTDDATTDPRKRPGLAECLAFLKPGDVLVVSSSAQLSHAVTHFLSTFTGLSERGVRFRSLSEPALCTDAPSGVSTAAENCPLFVGES